MTVSSTVAKSGPYNGNGVTTTFNRTFRILSASHIRVVQTVDGVSTDITSGFSQTGIGADSGSVVFSVAPATGATITLFRNVPREQQSDYSAQASVDPEVIEDDFDLVVMQVQDLAVEVSDIATDVAALNTIAQDAADAADTATTAAAAAVAAAAGLPTLATVSGLAIASGALTADDHGLGVIPKIYSLELECIAADQGWPVGQKIAAALNNSTEAVERVNVVHLTDTQVRILYTSAANCFTARHGGTNALVALTNAKWVLNVHVMG